jgi:hypothetical protein
LTVAIAVGAPDHGAAITFNSAMNHLTSHQMREQRAAVADVVAAAYGVPPETIHPLAQAMSLRAAVALIGQTLLRENENPQHAFARGLASSDFGALLAQGATPATLATFTRTAEHRAYCSVVPVHSFEPENIHAMEEDTEPLEPLQELQKIPVTPLLPTSTGPLSVALRTYGKIVAVSRQLVVNGDLVRVLSSLKNVAGTAARQEALLLANLMEASVNMSDGQPMFDAQFMNVEATALDATSLGAAVSLLRTQHTSSGQPAGLSARHLVVAPDLEFAARRLVHDSGMSIEVSALAGLTVGRWFLLADPDVCPVVGLLQLEGSRAALRVEQLGFIFESDALPIRVTADLGCTWLRRTGVVRGGV